METLLRTLADRGVELWTDGEQLHYRAPRQALTPELVGALKARKPEAVARLRDGWVSRRHPLSHPQRSLWYLYQSAPESPAYNTAMAVRLRFDPEPSALRAALQALVVRHPSLRTTFVPAGGPDGVEPTQEVHAFREVAFEEVDATGWSEAELRERVRADHQRPFDLVRGPVVRARRYGRGPADHVLLVSIHHIVCDGWSMWLLMDELWAAYVARTKAGREGATAPEVPSVLGALAGALAVPAEEAASAAAGAGGAKLERLVIRGLGAALARLGLPPGPVGSREGLRERLRVLPRHARLLDALLDLRGDGNGPPVAPDELRAERDRLAAEHPELDAYLALTGVCLQALPEILTGERSAMEVLFPGGSMDLVERTYRGNAVADFYNQRVAGIARAYVEERRRRDPAAVVRILEVGAGTGGASAGVLEALANAGLGDAVRYLYTDVSPAFVRHGERTFGERHPFVEFRCFDVERDPRDQGLEAGGVDLVIASAVLHATRRIDDTLRNAKALLRRNGLLVLNEITRAQAFLTVSFGLMDGWWRFEDEAARMKGSPLLDREQWRVALEARGFGNVRRVSLLEEGARGGSPQTVLVAEGDGALPPRAAPSRPAGTYEEFVRAQAALVAGAEGERHWAYWQRQLAGTLPVLDLPLDRPRPAIRSQQGRWVPFRIPPELAAGLRHAARERGVTLYGLLLAGYQLLLHRYAGLEDVIVGCPSSGRQDRAHDGVVGHFVNTLPVRVDLSGAPTVGEAVHRVREALLGALEHQALPFPVLVERLKPRREPGRTPVFQTLFVFQEPPQDLALADVVTDFYSGSARATLHGLEFESFPVSQQEGQFDLSIEVTGAGDSLKGVLKYDEDLFEAATMERMSRHYLAVLRAIVEHPEARVGEVELAEPAERRPVVEAGTGTARDWPLVPVHQLFEAQARRRPEAEAIRVAGRAVTYGALDRRANALAHHLVARGVQPGEPVAICLERSVDAVAAILGVLKAGGGYVPLDPTHPRDRLAFQLEDAGVRVLVTEGELATRLGLAAQELVRLDVDGPAIGGAPDLAPGVAIDAGALAYVLFTSGSTGRPKGVAMPHGPLCNLIRWQLEASTVGEGARTLQLTTLGFDVSFQEIFATLAAGGVLVLAPEPLRRDPEGLLRLLEAEGVQRLFLPFVMLKLLAEAAEGREALLPRSLREVVTAGEQLRITPAIAALFTALPDCRLVNQYGPTEAHVVTAYPLEGPPAVWPYLPPIGRPIANTRVHVVDAAMRPVPAGVPGEVVIGGACLARGYHRRPEETAQRFVSDPQGGPGERLYRTGDLARLRADGAIEYLGRADQQVKVHGFRIEPAEVEQQLLAHPAVLEAVVVAHADDAGAKRLCGYVVWRGAPDADGLRAHLTARLPAHMIPAVLVDLPALPLTPSGKVDRRALPRPQAPAAARAHVAPRDDVEARLVEVCRGLLRLERLGVEDDLFDLGVNSLTTLALQRAIDAAFPGRITVPDLVRTPTIGGLAAAIRARDGTASAPAPSPKAEQYQRFLSMLSGGT